jgi:hypothetical protein
MKVTGPFIPVVRFEVDEKDSRSVSPVCLVDIEVLRDKTGTITEEHHSGHRWLRNRSPNLAVWFPLAGYRQGRQGLLASL